MPFGDDGLVVKIVKKMVALLRRNKTVCFVNRKCDPSQAFILGYFFAALKPRYPINKRHWNSVYLDGSVPSGEIEGTIEQSYTGCCNHWLKWAYRPCNT